MSTAIEKTAVPEKDSAPKSKRLLSLDALRGFDMFWIMGDAAVLKTLAALLGLHSVVQVLETQMRHPEWHGFTCYDLIFPLFLFIAGVSMPFSFEKRRQLGHSTAKLRRHVIFRGLMLVFLGLIYNEILKFEWESMRYPSVLGRIGLAYLFAGLIVLNTKVRGQIIWFFGLLIAYWAALKFIPVPGFGAGDLSPGHTLTDYIDRLVLPGKLYQGDRDPEGLFGVIPAISTALSGVMAGQLLKNENKNEYVKILIMVVAGFFCLGGAYLWNIDFPINKNLWSSSFVLNCTGYSLLLLSFFYLVIDVWKFKSWAFFFIVIGSNPILIYMAPDFIHFEYTVQAIFGGSLKHAGQYEPFCHALAMLMVQWGLLYFCYRKKIFLRI